MQYITGIKAYKDYSRSAVTLGKFDGLHRGHEKLVGKVAELGKLDAVRSIVCAFDMLPLYERLNQPATVLMTKEERCQRLEDRVDYLVDCPFTESFSQMEAEDFIKDVLADIFHAAYVVVGTDFCFGHDKRGDIHMLAAYAKEYEYELIVVEKERYEDRDISSTFIKEALREGNMQLARELLGYPYLVSGHVEQGRKLGRTLGFPTCNVAIRPEKLMPPNGVYIERVKVSGQWFPAIGNVGVKPTVTDSGKLILESHLFGYDGDAYGKQVLTEFYEFCRPEQKFSGVEEMKVHVQEDIACGRRFFGLS